jgi:peptide/nickel transport system permease protein
VLRSNILDTINEDYVRTAKAKGLPYRRVMVKHVLRNSLIPIVTLFGLDLRRGESAVARSSPETVFDLKGVGWYAARPCRTSTSRRSWGVTIYATFFIVLFSVSSTCSTPSSTRASGRPRWPSA